MGKSKRKRKIKEQDFKKVKLKVGKKLPQGQNVTDTSFKSRAIVLPSQLSKDGKPTNQRRQTLKDLLNQACHYSASVRQDALVGLRDLVQLHPAVLHENLSTIIHRVAEKFTDVEHTVRHSLLLLLRSIFPLVTPERMAPFSALLFAHLSCAMTHIYEDIQLDSLNFLDLCLKHYPDLIATNSSQCLQNFLGLITHQTSTSSTVPSKGGAVVMTNPKRKFSSQGSRLKVLQQLFDFLKALKYQAKPSHEKPDRCNTSLKKPTVTFIHGQATAVQVLSHSVNEPVIPTLVMTTSSMPTSSTACVDAPLNVFSNLHDLQNFTQTVVPLLLECWMECNPAEMTTDLPNNSTTSVKVVTMATVIRILRLLLQANTAAESESKESNGQWFVETYLKDFKQNFMAFFPFESTFTGLGKGRGKAKSVHKSAESCNPDMSVISINIGICDIMSYFITEQSLQDVTSVVWVRKLQEFVSENFDTKAAGGGASQQLQAEHIQSLTDFVARIVQLSTAGQIPGAGDLLSVEELLTSMFRLYQSSHLMSAVKEVLFKFYTYLVLGEQTMPQQGLLAVLDDWLESLSRMLVQLKTSNPEMTGLVLTVLANALMRGKICEPKDLNENLTQFVDADIGFFLSLGEEIQKSTVDLLFHLPSIDDSLLRVLAASCSHSSIKTSTRQYLLQVLHYRSPCHEGFQKKLPAFSLASYLSFLFTVGIGFSNLDMSFLQEEATSAAWEMSQFWFDFSKCVVLVEAAWSAACPQGVDSREESTLESWTSHEQAVKAVCQIYSQCGVSGNLLQLMNAALDRFLAEFRVLPLKAIHGLCCLIKCWRDLSSQPAGPAAPVLSPPTAARLGDVALAGLSYCVTTGAAEPTALQSLKQTLLQDVAKVLTAHPPVLHGMLASLRMRFAAAGTSAETERSVVMVITQLLQTPEVKSILLGSADVLDQLVLQLLDSDVTGSGHDQCKADLKYQYALFKTAQAQH